MLKLFVDKTIEINASASKVWEALTKSENTDVWAMEFTGGNPFHIISSWNLRSPVLWKDNKGTVLVEGKVTKVETNKFLRFTVSDTRSKKLTLTDEDGITYKLINKNRKTLLQVRQGDFSVIPNGKKYFEATKQNWEKVLPKVKDLAEKIV